MHIPIKNVVITNDKSGEGKGHHINILRNSCFEDSLIRFFSMKYKHYYCQTIH